MLVIKDHFDETISLKHALEWGSLAGFDEIIGDAPHNYLAQKPLKQVIKPLPTQFSEAKPAPITPPSIENTLSFDACKTLEELEKAAKESDQYQTLSKTASHMLFGQGSPNAKIMVIAEQPGRHEDMSNTLFSGPEGAFVRSVMGFTGVDENGIYYTYLSKWRPPGGRKLNDSEKNNLSILLKKQINMVAPQLVVTLGETALDSLIPKTELAFRKAVGNTQTIDNKHFGTNIAFLPLFHEETLLKTPQLKKTTWLSIVNCKGDLIQ